MRCGNVILTGIRTTNCCFQLTLPPPDAFFFFFCQLLCRQHPRQWWSMPADSRWWWSRRTSAVSAPLSSFWVCGRGVASPPSAWLLCLLTKRGLRTAELWVPRTLEAHSLVGIQYSTCRWRTWGECSEWSVSGLRNKSDMTAWKPKVQWAKNTPVVVFGYSS